MKCTENQIINRIEFNLSIKIQQRNFNLAADFMVNNLNRFE